jgi:DNA modification methylase
MQIHLGSKEGDLVFDPFMGVGSTGVAALNMGRRFLGFDQDATYVDAEARRLRDVCGVKVMPVKHGEPPPFLLMESPLSKSTAGQSLSIAA